MDFCIGNYCNNIYLGYYQSTFSYALYHRLIQNKNIKSLMITEKLHNVNFTNISDIFYYMK